MVIDNHILQIIIEFILQDEHIQWLVEMLHVNPHVAIESLRCQLNEAFQFPRLVSINYVLFAIQSQVGFILELMCYEPNDFNNEAHCSFTLMMTYKQSS